VISILALSCWAASCPEAVAEEQFNALGYPVSNIDGFDLVETESSIFISYQSNPILAYNIHSPPVPSGVDPIYQCSGFLHPVWSPGGSIVTATFPFDHPHQHGVFSAWVDTSYAGQSIDFWNLAKGAGRVLHERVVSTFVNQASAGFEVDLIHRIESSPPVNVLRERWKISASLTEGSYYCFDLETTQQALTDEPLIINRYHYGGVALRGPVSWLKDRKKDQSIQPDYMPNPITFLNNHHSNRIEGNHEHANWVAMAGLIHSKPVSVAVLCHPDSFRAPQAARLHPNKPYFCFVPCADSSFIIDKEHPYKARYRFVISDAATEAPLLDRIWQDWKGE